MITEEAFTQLLKAAFPDADIAVMDKTGAMNHFRLYIASDAFAGKNLIEQHQMVYRALDEVMKEGKIHAVEITTAVPQAQS